MLKESRCTMTEREDKEFGCDHYDRQYFEGHLLRYKGPVYSQRISNVKRFLGDIKGKTVLDLGCGVGFFSELCRVEGAAVISMDFSADALRFCREEYGGRLALTNGDATSLPYRSGCFDLVLLNDIIEHLTPQAGRSMIEETGRVLKKGGKFILDTDNRRYIMHLPGLKRINAFLQKNTVQQKALVEIKKINRAPSLHVKVYDVNELTDMFEGCGFEIEAFDTYPYIAHTARDAFFSLPLISRVFKTVKGDVQIYLCRKPG